VLVGVVVVALGWDTGFLARLSLASTTPAEQRLVDRLASGPRVDNAAGSNELPYLGGATGWINTAPLTAAALHGHVVMLDVWTYSCINCLRTLPYVKAWAAQYAPDELIVIGVHSPEFAFERDPANVAHAVRDLGVAYPVALDNNYAIWRALDNQYWPAQYLIDTAGRIRYRSAGEGHDAEIEQHIRTLLAEAGHTSLGRLATVDAGGAEAAPAMGTLRSPETYIGYRRAERFVSAEPVRRDAPQTYSPPTDLRRNDWGLRGTWTVGPEAAALDSAPGSIVFRFHARDVHLVLGPAVDGRAARFRVRIDGKAPMEDHGSDTDADGNGTVTTQRLYQLIRQQGPVVDHSIEIEFLDPGVNAYAFTFG
jgi:thiol-disulfide isomerase/thioredoxin